MYREDARTPQADFALAKLLTIKACRVWCVTAKKGRQPKVFPEGKSLCLYRQSPKVLICQQAHFGAEFSNKFYLYNSFSVIILKE
jgi:hypothetical protein